MPKWEEPGFASPLTLVSNKSNNSRGRKAVELSLVMSEEQTKQSCYLMYSR